MQRRERGIVGIAQLLCQRIELSSSYGCCGVVGGGSVGASEVVDLGARGGRVRDDASWKVIGASDLSVMSRLLPVVAAPTVPAPAPIRPPMRAPLPPPAIPPISA